MEIHSAEAIASLTCTIIPIITCILGAFLGAFITYRFNIWKDKRSEFNKVAEPIIDILEEALRVLRMSTNEGRALFASIEEKELLPVIRRLNKRDRALFRQCFDIYAYSHSNTEQQKAITEMLDLIALK